MESAHQNQKKLLKRNTIYEASKKNRYFTKIQIDCIKIHILETTVEDLPKIRFVAVELLKKFLLQKI